MALRLWTREQVGENVAPDHSLLTRSDPLDALGDALVGLCRELSWRPVASSLVSGFAALQLGHGFSGASAAVVLAAIATGMCVGAAWQNSGRARVSWAAFALGSALWCAGHESRPVWETASSSGAGGVSVANMAALGAIASLVLGILVLLELPERLVAKLRYVAEGSMLTASILFASWVLVMPPAFDATQGLGRIDQARLLSYPIGDVLLLAVVVFAIIRSPELNRWSALLLGGIGALALLSSASSNLGDSGYSPLIDLTMAIAFTAVAVAATRSWQPARDVDRQPVPRSAQLLLLSAPGLSVLIVVGTTLRQAMGHPVAAELTWITIGVLTLSVWLHLTVTIENHALSAELEVARDEAILASTLKSHFLANVSHEIRTPMNAVIGLTGLLLDTDLDVDQRELAIGVATSAEGLLGLIDAVLDFSKIEANKMVLEQIDLDLEDLIDDVAMIVADTARRKGIELHAYCEPGMVTMRRGDPVRLRQILLNLANNAVKFTPKGSVTVQAMPVDDDPDQVAFLVIDTGIGIPEAHQARLFEPFSQLDESTTRKFGGTGLGLGIVTGLVELQQGSIELASEEGVGTVFRVTLPLPRGAPRTTEKGLAALVGLRALVVDDNAVNRSVLAHTLHGWGFIVDQAATAEEALDQFAWSGSPDEVYALAIIEHRMTGMDGMELARVLRSQRPTASAVILLLSSSLTLSRQAAHDAGIQSVLIKPVRNTYLLRRIVDALIPTPVSEPASSGDQRKVAVHAGSAPNPRG